MAVAGGEAETRAAVSLTVLSIAHNRVELMWHPLAHDQSHDRSRDQSQDPLKTRCCYTVQEEEVGKGRGFTTIYSGYSTYSTSSGLSFLSQYRYRIRADQGPWSDPTTITTAREPKTADQLHRAIARGDVESTQQILQTCPHYLNIPNVYGLSPLMHASRLGNSSITELLLGLDTDVEYCNKAGKTSLMGAAYNGHLECVRQLVSKGASWSTTDQSGMSALHWAVDGGCVPVVLIALNEGAKVDSVSDNTIAKITPLLKTASISGNAAVARVLIDHSACVNTRNSDGQTALILAALGGHDELTRVLLEAGADPTIATPHNQTPLDIARAMEKESVVAVLEEHARKQLQELQQKQLREKELQKSEGEQREEKGQQEGGANEDTPVPSD